MIKLVKITNGHYNVETETRVLGEVFQKTHVSTHESWGQPDDAIKVVNRKFWAARDKYGRVIPAEFKNRHEAAEHLANL